MPFQKPCIAALSEDDSSRAPNKLASTSPNFAPPPIFIGGTALSYDNDSVHSNAVAGESSLDRFACGIGGKAILPHIIATVPQLLQNCKQ